MNYVSKAQICATIEEDEDTKRKDLAVGGERADASDSDGGGTRGGEFCDD